MCCVSGGPGLLLLVCVHVGVMQTEYTLRIIHRDGSCFWLNVCQLVHLILISDCMRLKCGGIEG